MIRRYPGPRTATIDGNYLIHWLEQYLAGQQSG
jgi:hypothetical protein